MRRSVDKGERDKSGGRPGAEVAAETRQGAGGPGGKHFGSMTVQVPEKKKEKGDAAKGTGVIMDSHIGPSRYDREIGYGSSLARGLENLV